MENLVTRMGRKLILRAVTRPIETILEGSSPRVPAEVTPFRITADRKDAPELPCQVEPTLEPLDDLIEQAILEAGHEAEMGVEDPSRAIEQVRIAFEHASESHHSRTKWHQNQISQLDGQILRAHQDLTQTETRLYQDWSKTPRAVTSLADAEVATNELGKRQNKPFGPKSLLIGGLFVCEFLLSYFLFIELVFVNKTPSDHLISALIGLITVLVAVYVKALPDNVRDPKVYDRRKSWVALLAGLSSAAFILCVVVLREFIPTDLSHLSVTTPPENGDGWIWITFNLSLLSSLIFVASFLEHLGVHLPVAYLSFRADSARELFSWHLSDQYGLARKRETLEQLVAQRNSFQAELGDLELQSARFNFNRIAREQARACLEFLRAAQSPPFTNSKQRAAENAKRALAALSTRDTTIA